jgi:hypothetical protein
MQYVKCEVRTEYLNIIKKNFKQFFTRVEAGSNTSTVTLRVVGGEENEVANLRL